MRLVVQRVRRAAVHEGTRRAAIGPGLVALVGFCRDDGEPVLRRAAEKLAAVRVFPDTDGRLSRSLRDTGGGLLLVPNFTLCGDTRRGNRPDFSAALAPGPAAALFDGLLAALRETGLAEVAAGWFGADMVLELVNDGPVTLVLDLPGLGRR